MIVTLALGAINCGALASLCGAIVPDEIVNVRPCRLVTDSREIVEGDLFCALKGLEDGHKYAAEAEKRGAIAVLVEKKTDARLPHIIVPSVRKALGDWAIGVTEDDALLRIGITGSVGKTTVKDAIASMLSPHFSVHATYGNFNNDLGLPFTLLSAPGNTEIAVCELGVNHKGEMRELSRILRPHISVITCIGHAHIGAFGTREAIAAEKLDILAYAKENSAVFVPEGEPLLSCIPPRGIRRISTLPFGEKEYTAHGLSYPFEDTARSFALGYAAKVGEHLSLSEKAIHAGLERILSLETHRHESVLGGFHFIDDGYNASPESMLGALRYLASQSGKRRVAVLGDMLELGEQSSSYHRAIGRFAARHAERLFFFGAYAKDYEAGARAEGMRRLGDQQENFRGFSVIQGDKETLAAQILSALQEGDVILFKASRALQVEKIIDHIKKQIS